MAKKTSFQHRLLPFILVYHRVYSLEYRVNINTLFYFNYCIEHKISTVCYLLAHCFFVSFLLVLTYFLYLTSLSFFNIFHKFFEERLEMEYIKLTN